MQKSEVTFSDEVLGWSTSSLLKLLLLQGRLGSYDGCSKENVTIKWNFALGCVLRLFHVVYAHLLGKIGFHEKAENQRFTTVVSRRRQNLKYENFTLSFGRLRQKFVLKRVPQMMQHDYFSAFNQSNHRFVALSFLYLPILIPYVPSALEIARKGTDSFSVLLLTGPLWP